MNVATQLLIVVLTTWTSCLSLDSTQTPVDKPSNWTSADAPCEKYDDLLNRGLANIGVKIDASEPWADDFRRALNFWNTVLPANFHKVTNLDTCSILVVDAGHPILKDAVVARSQFTDRANFRGKIAVNPAAAKRMDSAQRFRTAVHELGHMLGLSHNASADSIMYPIDFDDAPILDSQDISELSSRHELQPGMSAITFLPVAPVQSGARNKAVELKSME